MIVVVNDANILIDLIKLKLVDSFFNINWKFHSTSLIIKELRDEQQQRLNPYIDNGKLIIIYDFNLEDIVAIRSQKPKLSDADCSALHCAQKLNASLITSDNVMRKCAKELNVEVHGHLWVLDELVKHNYIDTVTVINKLKELNAINPKAGLPQKECNDMIEKWKKLNQSLNPENQGSNN